MTIAVDWDAKQENKIDLQNFGQAECNRVKAQKVVCDLYESGRFALK